MHRPCTGIRFCIAATAFAVASLVSAAEAQTSDAKWEVELHGGGILTANPTSGTASLPGPGEAFTTSGIFPPPSPQVIVTATSRRQSSWFFGDGPVLFDQAATSLAANPTAMTSPFAQRLVTLDSVLGRALGEAKSGGSIGARVSRALTPRLTAEVSFDYSLMGLEIAQVNGDAIEATRASFTSAFNGLIRANPGRTLLNLNAAAEFEGLDAHQLVTSGALLVNLRTTGVLVPYATFGAALVSILGERPRATLTGNYRFSNPSAAVFDETDTVVVRDARDSQALAAILGGGVKYHISPRWGIRADARVSIAANTDTTVIDATPDVKLGQATAGRVTLNANPTLQFGNSSAPVTSLGVTGLAPSTLSGPAIRGHRTWSGSGISSHTNITAGLFWRF